MLSTENKRLPRDCPRRRKLTLLMCPPLYNSYNNDLRIENRAWTPLASRNSGSCPATLAGVALTEAVVFSVICSPNFFESSRITGHTN
jgi:hypothetical protein